MLSFLYYMGNVFPPVPCRKNNGRHQWKFENRDAFHVYLFTCKHCKMPYEISSFLFWKMPDAR